MAEIGRWRTGRAFTAKRILLASTVLFTLVAGGLAVSTASRFIHRKNVTNAQTETPTQQKSPSPFTLPKPLREPINTAPKQTPVQPSKPVTKPIERPPKTAAPETKTRRVWCIYDPLAQKILNYIESETNPAKGNELGSAGFFSLDNFEGARPLAVACHTDGTIWIVGEKSVYTGKIVPRENPKDDYTVKDIVEVSHTNIPEEQRPPGTKVIAASIWWPVKEAVPVIASITNNGFFQVFRPPQNKPTVSEKFILELNRGYWPENTVGAVLGVLNTSEFAIIPLTDRKIGTNTHIYYYKWPDASYKKIEIEDSVLIPIDIKRIDPNVVNIFAASPVIYSEERGGWVSTLHATLKDGSAIEIPTNVKPKNVE